MADQSQTSDTVSFPAKVYTGRSVIVCHPIEITSKNVVEQLNRSLFVHSGNAAEEDYLHKYFLGIQPVLKREKLVRPEIKNTVVENRAYQIAKDRTDSLFGEPVNYSVHGNGGAVHGEDAAAVNDELSHAIQRLNDCCTAADKHAADLELGQWLNEVGVGYRLVLPNSSELSADDRPFVVATLDPRCTFVVYTADVFRAPLYAATYVKDEDDNLIYTVYTAKKIFVIKGGKVESEKPNPLGQVPIIEYIANPERMGVFEAVLALFDAINEIESNRVDGISQFVQALMVLENVDLGDDSDETQEEFERLMKSGCVLIHSTTDNKASVQMLTAELNQEQTQTLVDSLYKTALSICGMPFNVGGSASTSDTGAAVTMRDGWSNSENRCKETEILFKRSERLFLLAALEILAKYEHVALGVTDIEIKFTRRNYEAIQSKTQVLTTMLGSGKIHPRLAFEHCGMFSDPEAAYDLSQQYVDEQVKKQLEIAQQTAISAGSDINGSDNAGAGDTSAKDNDNGDATSENKA